MLTYAADKVKSTTKERLVYGVGVNDSDYVVFNKVGGNRFMCPFYTRWVSMLRRCYSLKVHDEHPGYVGCSVISSWLSFSNFKSWMENQDWKGNHLDKDLLIQGNKIYSADTCIFVSGEINSLLTNHKAKRGSYPQGVCFVKKTKKYVAKVKLNGKAKHLGVFNDPWCAYAAYKKAKYKIIEGVALHQSEPLRSALLNYKIGE